MSGKIFRDVPVDSPIHRMRTEAKLLVLAAISTSLVWAPHWPVVGGFIVFAAIIFKVAKLPLAVIPRLPMILWYGIIGGGISALLSGGDPLVLGLPLGGLLEYLRLITMGMTLIFFAGLMAWTTGLTELGAGLSRVVRPLRHVGVPADELTTVLALTTRSLPLIADEVGLVNDAVVTRPMPKATGKQLDKFRHYMGFVTDMAVSVVVGGYRRSRDMARAMTVRASMRAPVPESVPWKVSDVLVMILAVAGAVVAIWLG